MSEKEDFLYVLLQHIQLPLRYLTYPFPTLLSPPALNTLCSKVSQATAGKKSLLPMALPHWALSWTLSSRLLIPNRFPGQTAALLSFEVLRFTDFLIKSTSLGPSVVKRAVKQSIGFPGLKTYFYDPFAGRFAEATSHSHSPHISEYQTKAVEYR